VRIRQHVNPRSLHFEQFRGTRPAIPAKAVVEIEIGCADAQFLFERARVAPEHVFVGLEIREDLVALVNRRAGLERVPVSAVFCQAQLHLLEIFAASSIDRIYLNFPDPWFKRRHQSRRMIDGVLADGIARVARPGAEIFVQTDVWDIALDALAVLERVEALSNLAGEWSFWRDGNPYGARSWREEHAVTHGLPIWRLRYRRS
jgi:tRNA (guanine-N7-)-methyltransferase